MSTFQNDTIGSHDNNSSQYVEVWFDETLVRSFSFHSVGTRDVLGNYFRVHGMEVEARHVFQACRAFSVSPDFAISSNGEKRGVTHVWLNDGSEELRLGNKYGQAIARLKKTGYVQK
jgi:hypothetical protein